MEKESKRVYSPEEASYLRWYYEKRMGIKPEEEQQMNPDNSNSRRVTHLIYPSYVNGRILRIPNPDFTLYSGGQRKK